MSISKDDMMGRIARFRKLKASPQAFLDSRLPGHEREIFNVIGHGVTEDAALQPAITDAPDFNVTYIGAAPGKGAALHDHPTVEVFIPLSGRWAVLWGDEGENEVVLEAWDVISVPPGSMRGFRNVGDEYAHLMAILGGTDAGKVTWARDVIETARKSGLTRDREGNLVELAE